MLSSVYQAGLSQRTRRVRSKDILTRVCLPLQIKNSKNIERKARMPGGSVICSKTKLESSTLLLLKVSKNKSTVASGILKVAKGSVGKTMELNKHYDGFMLAWSTECPGWE